MKGFVGNILRDELQWKNSYDRILLADDVQRYFLLLQALRSVPKIC